MIFVFADDQSLDVLSDIEAIRRECEPIDVESDVFEFFDENGYRLVPHFVEPVKQSSFLSVLFGGTSDVDFELVADVEDDGMAFFDALTGTVLLDENGWFGTLEEVASYVGAMRDSRGVRVASKIPAREALTTERHDDTAMRDPNRIDPLLELLGRAWKADPDLRLGQLITNAASMGGWTNRNDVFNVEDDLVEDGLRQKVEKSD